MSRSLADRWTPQQDALLIAGLRARRPITQIAADLGRSFQATRYRIRFLREVDEDAPPSQKTTYRPETAAGLTADDHAWMAYWRQRGAQRRAQRSSPEARHA